jgi:AcrR family transcriptional regulator
MKPAGEVSMNSNCKKKSTLTVQKNKITDAAGKCIIRKGVSGSSMKEIQDASGMGAGQIYRHFSSKMKIVESVLEKNIRDQCNILPVIYSSAERSLTDSLIRFLENKVVTHVLRLNTILRVESVIHPELQGPYMRNYQMIENEHVRLLSHSFPKMSGGDIRNIMSVVDAFLFAWGGNSALTKGEFCKESRLFFLCESFIRECNEGAGRFNVT